MIMFVVCLLDFYELILNELLTFLFVGIVVSHDVLFWTYELEAARKISLCSGRKEPSLLWLNSNDHHPSNPLIIITQNLLSDGMYTKLGSCLLISVKNALISSAFSFFGLKWSTSLGIVNRSLIKQISLNHNFFLKFFSSSGSYVCVSNRHTSNSFIRSLLPYSCLLTAG